MECLVAVDNSTGVGVLSIDELNDTSRIVVSKVTSLEVSILRYFECYSP